MSTNFADFKIAVSNGDTFSNASRGDLMVFTETSNQSITFGNLGQSNSVLRITPSNVDLLRPLAMSNTVILDMNRNLSNVNIDTSRLTSGVLPVARGGTGATTFANNGVVYVNTSGAQETNANLSYNATTGTFSTSNINFTGSLTRNGVAFQSGTSGLSNNGSNIFVVTGCNLGIGTSTPASRLDVSGDINFTGSLTRNGVAFQSGISGLSNNSSNIFLVSGCNLGIGTSTPQARLHVVGSTQLDGDLSLQNTQLRLGSIKVAAPTTINTSGVVTTNITAIPGLNTGDTSNYALTLSNAQSLFGFKNTSGSNVATVSSSGVFNTNSVQTGGVTRIANDGGLSNVRIDAGSVIAGTLPVARGGTGVTTSTGTGNNVLSDSPTFTGTVTAATLNATTLTGNGSGLTNLNAANIASGTLPVARGGTGVTTSTGTGNNVLSDSPTFTGTVTAATLNATTLQQGGTAISSLFASASHTHDASAITTGTLPVARGGTGTTTSTGTGSLVLNSNATLAGTTVTPTLDATTINLGASSKTSKGFTTLPNGLLLQWGSTSLNQDSGNTGTLTESISFARAFSSTPYSVTANWAHTPNLVTNAPVVVITALNANGFVGRLYTPGNVNCDITGAGGRIIYWTAIGPL